MKPNLPQPKKRQRAQAMVEFALVFPLLILVVYSLLEFGRLLFIYISVINSSREAARYGSSVGNPSAYRYLDCDGILDAARRSAILNRIQPSDVSITYDMGDLPSPTVMFGGAQCGDPTIDPAAIKTPHRVNVQVTLQYSPIMPVQWASFPITARSSRTIIKSIEVAGDNVGELGTPSVQFTSGGGGTFDEGTVHTVQLVMLGGTSTSEVTVGLAIEAGTADGADISMPLEATFGVGSALTSVDVSLLTEPCDEEDIETLKIKIVSVPSGIIKGYPLTYTINIHDMDPTPNLYFGPAGPPVLEDAGAAAVQVYMDVPSCREVSYSYGATGGSATLGEDYELPPLPDVIPPNGIGKVTALTLIDDELYEGEETVQLTLTAVQNATIGVPPDVLLTIAEDDPQPVISFDVATAVSSEEIGKVIIYARMDRFSTLNTGVTLSIIAAGTTAQEGVDFDVDVGSLTIPAGQREKEILITIYNNDTEVETDETVRLQLSNPVEATLGSPFVHDLTIRETSEQPEVSFQSAGFTRLEDYGISIARLVLSEAAPTDVSVTYGVAGSASAGFDYGVITPGTVLIPKGAVSGDILVPILDDPFDELFETIILNIASVSGATPSEGGPNSHTITIEDNDDSPVVAFLGSSTILEEGATLTITAALTKPSNLAISVPFTAAGAPAGDYTLLTASPLVFAPGSTSQTIQVSFTDDGLFTGSRELVLTLGAPDYATLGDPSQYTVTILDNEVCPTMTPISINGKNLYTTVGLPGDAPLIQLTSLTATMQSGQQLKQVDMGAGNVIFQGTINTSPAVITTFKSGADLFLSGPAGGRALVLSFQDAITIPTSYSVELVWSNGCTVRKP